jgi:cytochrome c
MKFKASCLSLVAISTLGLTPMAMADGAALYTAKLCNTCHGPDGNSPTTAMYPKIAGMDKDYLIEQMLDIRTGKRNNGMSIAMKATVASVKDEEFTAIAEWLAEQSGFGVAPVADDAAAALYQEKGCAACHGDDAISPVVNDENGIPTKLAGQTEHYLFTQMKDIRDGKRINGHSDKMKVKVEGISDADFQAMAKWLAAAK